MARIAGVDLPREKRIEIGLTYIYGIGRPTADKLLAEAGVNPDTRVRDITDDEVKKISEAIEKLGVMVEGDLSISVGKRADFVLLDQELNIVAVYIDGKEFTC